MNIAKEKIAIQRLKSFAPEEGYYVGYSGGKDSDAVRILCGLAAVKHDLVHNLTTMDAPETINYIKSQKDVHIDQAIAKDGKPQTIWKLIVQKHMPPTRIARYCCSELKERGGVGRFKVLGVRWAESINRRNNADVLRVDGKPQTMQKLAEEMGVEYTVTPKGSLALNYDNTEARRMTEQCYRTATTMLNPIVDWSDADVWSFLNHYGCKSNPLYACGEKRIGCIGCPMQGSLGMQADFIKYPVYKGNFIKAFDRMLAVNDVCTSWRTGQDVYDWWIQDDPDQMHFALA